MNRPFKFAILAVILVMPIYSAKASGIRAFHNINQLPFKQIFGLPSLDNSPLTETGKWRVGIITNISNTFDVSGTANEQIATDIETFTAADVAFQLALVVTY